MHIDLGDELVDHHSFFFFVGVLGTWTATHPLTLRLQEGPVSHIHHSSFEVHDFDIQVLGHDWLRQRGYKNCWGVGRHVMGSQIFDYWYVVCRCECMC